MTGEEFAEWLADEMSRQNLKVKELAAKAGLNEVTIRHYIYEQRSPTLAYMKLILDALGKKIAIVDA